MDAISGRLDEMARVWVESGGGLLPVSGRSMRPTFEDASSVRVEQVDRARFGDIIVHANGSFLVVHRVVEVRRGPAYRTKGDGLAHLDRGLVQAHRVLGRVVAIERRGRSYRTDRTGGRIYGRLIATVSAIEGFLYRFAYRLDRLLFENARTPPPEGGVTVFRRTLRGAGRLTIALLDGALFRLLHQRVPLAGR